MRPDGEKWGGLRGSASHTALASLQRAPSNPPALQGSHPTTSGTSRGSRRRGNSVL